MHAIMGPTMFTLLAFTATAYGEEITGTVKVPAPAAEKPKAADGAKDGAADQAKPATGEKPAAGASAAEPAPVGVVVWVENVKDAKPPAEKGTLSQKEGQFVPSLLVAVAGQTVTFPNDDSIAHNVFSMSATKKFNLGIYAKGDTKDVVFDKAGIIDVFCSLHRHMHAQIVVVPSVHFAVCKPGETFTIKDVPAGSYKVTAWSSGCAPQTMDVTIPEKGKGQAQFTLAAEGAKTADASSSTK